MTNPLERETPLRWRWGLLAALALMLLSLFPQAHLCYKRGQRLARLYAHFYSDEPAYAAYVNALIDGRPRRTTLTRGTTTARARPCRIALLDPVSSPLHALDPGARASASHLDDVHPAHAVIAGRARSRSSGCSRC
jgi:hypothetical protein